MNVMNAIIPRPVRDICVAPYQFSKTQELLLFRELKDLAALKDLGALVTAANVIEGIARIALVGLGTLALYKFGGSIAVAGVLTGIVSLPALLIAGGSWLMYYGAMMTASALSTGSFATLGIALASLGGGYLTLEYHDAPSAQAMEKLKASSPIRLPELQKFFPLGLAEYFVIRPLIEEYAVSLARWLRRS